MVRMNGRARGQIAAVRGAVRALNRTFLSTASGRWLARCADPVSLSRFRSLLMTAFHETALLLAAIGIYAVVAYAVAKRTREMGLRMALGATPSGVVAMVLTRRRDRLWRGRRRVIGAFLLTRALETMLFGVTASDAMTFVGAVAVFECCGYGGVLRPRHAGFRIDRGGPAQ